ncbi:MAG TPA: helix-turn-helix domain-containing protein, partial [Ferruginibacter sp.]|nr:helix-turn-helix domain-containing protein [Ferruginibacter sp.]
SAIAIERNLTVGTIETHLIPFIGDGEIEISELVPPQKQQLILDAVAVHGGMSHKTLIENLPADISYGEIKMVLAAEKVKAEQ